MLYTFYDDMELDTCLNLFCIMSKDTCLLFTVGVYFINQQFSFTHCAYFKRFVALHPHTILRYYYIRVVGVYYYFISTLV